MKRYRLAPSEASVLTGLAVFIVLTFLPWTYDLKLFNVSVLAWLLWLLMIVATGSGIVLALREPRE